jgi:hypothetical protein
MGCQFRSFLVSFRFEFLVMFLFTRRHSSPSRIPLPSARLRYHSPRASSWCPEGWARSVVREEGQDREVARRQAEELQPRHLAEHRVRAEEEGCLRVVLVAAAGRVEEAGRTGRSFWRGCGSSLSHS